MKLILLLVVTYPFIDIYFFTYKGLNFRLYNIIILLLAISYPTTYLKTVRTLYNKILFRTSIVFGLSLAITYFHSEYKLFTIRYVILELLGLFLIWFIADIIKSKEQVIRVLKFSFYVANWLACIEFIDYMLKLVGFAGFFELKHEFMIEVVGRISGPFIEPDRAAQYHLVPTLFTLPFILISSLRKEISTFFSTKLLHITFWINFLVIIISINRTALLAVLVSALWILYISSKVHRFNFLKRVSRISIRILLIFAFSMVLIEPWKDFVIKRTTDTITDIFYSEIESLSFQNSTFALMGYTIIKGTENPIWGNGWGTAPNYEFIYSVDTNTIPLKGQYIGLYYEVSWNRYVQFFYGAGLIGLVSYIIWQLGLVKVIWRHNIPLFWRCGFLSVFIGMMITFDQFRSITAYTPLYIVIGLSCAIGKEFPDSNKRKNLDNK